MKYEILQRLSIPNLTIEAGTVKTVEDWQKEYGYNESYMKSNPAWFREVPDDEPFTLERGNVMESWQVENVDKIETAIRELYGLAKGESRNE